MESNEDATNAKEAKGRTHIVPESILIKEEEEEAEMGLDMVVDEEDVELKGGDSIEKCQLEVWLQIPDAKKMFKNR